MQITTKFNLDDKVYFLKSDAMRAGLVHAIKIAVIEEGVVTPTTTITYTMLTEDAQHNRILYEVDESMCDTTATTLASTVSKSARDETPVTPVSPT